MGLIGILGAIAVFTIRQSRSSSLYTVTTLPSLGGDFTLATGINEKGQVVGFSEVASSEYHLFLWDRAHGMRDLGRIRNDLVRINDLGQITGTAATAGAAQAFFWDPNDGMYLLGTMGGGSSRGLGINNRGQVVGAYRTADTQSHAFVWDGFNGMQPIEVPGCGLRLAWAINDAGQAIVFGRGCPYMVSLDERGKVTACEPLPVKGLLDIDNTGRVAGLMQTPRDTFDLALWQKRSGLQTFPFDARDLDSPRINDVGQLVYSRTWDEPTGLFSAFGTAPRVSCLWDPNAGADPIPLSVPTKRSEQFGATDINNRGQIVGAVQSTKRGTSLAVLLEPTSGQSDATLEKADAGNDRER